MTELRISMAEATPAGLKPWECVQKLYLFCAVCREKFIGDDIPNRHVCNGEPHRDGT